MPPKKKKNLLAEEILRMADKEASKPAPADPPPRLTHDLQLDLLTRFQPRPAERDVPFDNQENLGEPQRQRALAKVRAEAEKRNGPRYQRNRGGK